MKRHLRLKQSLRDVNSNVVQHLIVHRNLSGLRVTVIANSLIDIPVSINLRTHCMQGVAAREQLLSSKHFAS